jgi:hypothetical protein
MKTIAFLQKSNQKNKKFKVTIITTKNMMKTIHLGARGYYDFTHHRNKTRRSLYINRHRSREIWTKSGMIKPGFWARWLLWSHPTLASAKAHISKQFDIVIRSGNPSQYLKNPKVLKSTRLKGL